MRDTVRLLVSLLIALLAVVSLFTIVQVHAQHAHLRQDLGRQARLLADSLDERVEALIKAGDRSGLVHFLSRIKAQDDLLGLAVYDAEGKLFAASLSLASSPSEEPAVARRARSTGQARDAFLAQNGRSLHLYARPVGEESAPGALVIVHDARALSNFFQPLWKEQFLQVFLQCLLVAIGTVLIVRWNFMGSVTRAAEWLKRLRLGEVQESTTALSRNLFGPLAREVSNMATSLSAARAAAENEARLREHAESLWTPDRLKEHVRGRLQDRTLFVVANREPYQHLHKGSEIICRVPASGLVTALEPILRACGGTWVAHGSGDADRESVDANDELRVPPDEPQYTLRRVWLSPEEEGRYYNGFANEGLWPLCHIAHTRPLFRADDWAAYQTVNRRFADTAVEKMKGLSEPLVLVQDYHFALVPRLIKEKRPDARVALFWHIPWPNPESFGICPWQREILDGMLGADLLGFHIQYHCNNFLDTVDRALESRVNWERFSITRRGHTTSVKPFPISVDFARPRSEDVNPSPKPLINALLKEAGVKAEFLGVGVDRIDYTKGLVERFRGIERFFEKNPSYVGRFTFAELGAPSRTSVKRYRDLAEEVDAEVERINARLQTREWKPIVMLKRHHSHADIAPFYRAADLCLVTSLHDGMNLVAKEFVAARDDEDGVLILSRFTGAARQLRDALIINPYDDQQVADAILQALEMKSLERTARMHRMRDEVRDHNIYRWGAALVSELAQIRLSEPAKARV